ncbi:hypothetical protein UT300012_24290 [Paraclostridium bifermentans]
MSLYRKLNKQEKKGLRNLAIIGVVAITIVGGVFTFSRDTGGKASEKYGSYALENKTGKYNKGINWSDLTKQEQDVLEGLSKDKDAIESLTEEWDELTPNIVARYGEDFKALSPDVNINLLPANKEFIKVRHSGEKEDVMKVNAEIGRMMEAYERFMTLWNSYTLEEDMMPNEKLMDKLYENLNVVGESYNALQEIGKHNQRARINQVFDNLQPMENDFNSAVKDLRKGFDERVKMYKDSGFSGLHKNMKDWQSLFETFDY